MSEPLPGLDMDTFDREAAMVCTPLRSCPCALFGKSDCSRSECSDWVFAKCEGDIWCGGAFV